MKGTVEQMDGQKSIPVGCQLPACRPYVFHNEHVWRVWNQGEGEWARDAYRWGGGGMGRALHGRASVWTDRRTHTTENITFP